MRRKLVSAFILSMLSVLWNLPVFAVVNISGKWHASSMGAVIEATINQRGHLINGVARVRNPSGEKNTYHFTGSIDGNRVTAAHHNGHRFAGTVNSNGQLVGVLRTKRGQQVSVTASRR